MLKLRRLPMWSLAGAVLVLALPVRAAEVDKYLPDDTEMVAVLNVKQILDAPLVKKHALEELRGLVKGSDHVTKILDSLGFDPFKDLSSITAALSMAGVDAKGLIIAHGQFDKAKFEAHAEEVAKNMGDVLKIHKEADRKVYEVKGGDKPVFVGVVDNTTIVAGPEKQYVLDAFDKGEGKKKGAVNKDIRGLIEKADAKQSLWFAATVNAFLKGDLSSDEKTKKSLEKVENVTAGISLDKGIKFAMAIAAKSVDNAKELAEEIKENLNQVKGLLALLAEQDKRITPAMDAVGKIQVNTEGSMITLKGELSEELTEKSLKKN